MQFVVTRGVPEKLYRTEMFHQNIIHYFRFQDITDLHVQVDLPDSNISDTHHIYTENIIELYR